MNEDIKKLGDFFKSKRKKLNFSLKDVENATSIRISHLESIEEGREDSFLSSVYMLGFIRQYASFLGMDPDKVLEDYPGVMDLEKQEHEFAYGIGTLEKRGSLGKGVKWVPKLMWTVFFACLIVLAYYFAKYVDVL